MTDPRTPVDELRISAEEFRKIKDRLDKLESPTGTSAYQSVDRLAATLAYLEGLKTYGATGFSFNSGTVPNTATFFYLQPSPVIYLTGIEIPTRRCLIEAALSEVSITQPNPGTIGGYVQAGISFELKDANGVDVPGAARLNDWSRWYTNQHGGIPLSTGPQFVEIDDIVLHPGPYTLRFWATAWSATGNVGTISIQYEDPTITLTVIGEGAVFG